MGGNHNRRANVQVSCSHIGHMTFEKICPRGSSSFESRANCGGGRVQMTGSFTPSTYPPSSSNICSHFNALFMALGRLLGPPLHEFHSREFSTQRVIESHENNNGPPLERKNSLAQTQFCIVNENRAKQHQPLSVRPFYAGANACRFCHGAIHWMVFASVCICCLPFFICLFWQIYLRIHIEHNLKWIFVVLASRFAIEFWEHNTDEHLRFD